jgi:hypothetical protein
MRTCLDETFNPAVLKRALEAILPELTGEFRTVEI